MANLLTNPGFEDGETGWTLGGGAEISEVQARSEPKSMLLIADPGVFGDPVDSECSQSFAVESGELYTVSAWYFGDETHGADLYLYLDRGDGSEQVFGILRAGSSYGWERWDAGDFQALGATASIRFVVSHTESPFLVDNWFLDDTSVVLAGGDDVAYTKTLRDALIDDLDDIDGTGIFVMAVAEVGREPKRLDDAQSPGLYLVPGSGGTSDEELLGNLRGYASQAFHVQLVVKDSATPNADMDNLLDDVRNAVERSAGNVLAVAGVESVSVTDWSEVLTDADVHQGTYYREVTVTVRYLYTRGEA